EYELITNAVIDRGWHLYSQSVPEDGPIPTTFIYETGKDAELIGATVEEDGVTVNDVVFNMMIKFFEDTAEFRQRIKVINKELSIVKGEVEFMVCDDIRCLPPTYIDLEFDLSKANADGSTTSSASDADKSGIN